MSDIDFDEDLLALAGAGDDSHDESAEESQGSGPQSLKRNSSDTFHGTKRTRNMDDDSENDDEEEEEEESNEATNGNGKPLINDGGSDSEDEFVNPYPLEGKYKDERDRAWLEGLQEVERESIFFDRSNEMQRYRESKYLTQRSKQQEKDKTTRRSTRDAPSSKKVSQLSELKKRREEKSNKSTTSKERPSGKDDDDYEEDQEEAEESDYEPEDAGIAEEKVEWDDKQPTIPSVRKDINASDLNKIRFGRSLFAKFCHNPGFEEAAIGCFVRINLGTDPHKNEPTYRLCQIKSIVPSKVYTFLNRTADEAIVVTHASSERTVEFGVCSDSAITDREFDWWKKSMEKAELSLPSVKKIERKFNELMTMSRRELTTEEVNNLIERRQKMSSKSSGANIVLEKSLWQQQRLIAVQKNDLAEVARIDRKLADLEKSINPSKNFESPLDKLAKVNERNRKANQDFVRKAEVKNNEERRKNATGSNVTSNPFSRLRTSVQIFYKSTEDQAAEKAAKETKTSEELNNIESMKQTAHRKPLNAIDDAIAGIELDLDFDI
ncbi:plus-3-domain-containing protein [Nadsonia fulvescens var. elongata DSM 6958]|uniref:Plus-3-domain-containing protein n=1 Tax=Nadsonia fulvescens var. elongata DSM 6958 TaxID=857566 RepID=A0A1E3PJ49_9ASCO|nr:plus-3-domain-containing protein [Nadsonia fulvescens var. elongata DSM 6958]